MPAPWLHRASTLPVPCQHHASTMPAPCQHRASTLPAPCQHRASTVPAPCQHHASTMAAPCQHHGCTVPAQNRIMSAGTVLACRHLETCAPLPLWRAAHLNALRRIPQAYPPHTTALLAAQGHASVPPTETVRLASAHEPHGQRNITKKARNRACSSWLPM